MGASCDPMRANAAILSVAMLLAVSHAAAEHTYHPAHADTVHISIVIDKDTYQYCDNLSYSISVSEVTGQVAVAHIIDQNGKKSQPIPVEISAKQSTIRAPFPFDRVVFPTGTYTIEVAYAGASDSDTFDLVDGGSTCMPAQIKQIAAAWLSGTFSDGFLVDAISKSVDPDMIEVPFEINQDVIYEITIPEWVKQSTYWWITGQISDGEVAGMFDYLLKSGIISPGDKIRMEGDA